MIILLVGLVLSALLTVMIRDLLKGAIALAVMSAVLTIILFLLKAPLAAVFELSVCAGLVTVVFISAISMTKLRTKEEITQHRQERKRRFLALPVILIALCAIALAIIWPHANDLLANVGSAVGAKAGAEVFWKERQVDLLGQIVIILAGVFGVLIFFKERGGE